MRSLIGGLRIPLVLAGCFVASTPLPACGPLQPGELIEQGDNLQVHANAQGLSASSSWSSVGALATAREWYAATLLPDGRVLVSGGYVDGTAIAGVEVYDPTSKSWTPGAPMHAARFGHDAIVMSDGRVLVIGGNDGSNTFRVTTELYDPTHDTWTHGASMNVGRSGSTVTLLPDGRVLVAGGWLDPNGVSPAPTEVYDPDADAWIFGPSLLRPRTGHAATLLENGTVFVCGGLERAGWLVETEIYDPRTNTWTPAAPLVETRFGHTTTLLSNGQVMLAGGRGPGTRDLISELYDPALDAWLPGAPMIEGRTDHTATLLQSGELLVVGGAPSGGGTILQSAELYDAVTDQWTLTPSMLEARYWHTATLLMSGEVLVVGGFVGWPLASAEIYGPDTRLEDGSPCESGEECRSGFCSAGMCSPGFDFCGFFQPIDNLPTVNTVKAGSAVPVKFSLGGDQGLDVFASGYPASGDVPCGAAGEYDAIEQIASASAHGLSYDPVKDQYTFVWKTARAWAGTCRTLVVKLADGVDHIASFKFR